MNLKLLVLILASVTVVLLAIGVRDGNGAQNGGDTNTNNSSHTPSLFDVIRGRTPMTQQSQNNTTESARRQMGGNSIITTNGTTGDEQPPTSKSGELEGEMGELEDEDEELEDDDDDDELEDDDDQDVAVINNPDKSKLVRDLFGNQLKLDNNRTILVKQNKARDLGLLTIKAILLGPLIGLTLKGALFRGLLWALTTYLLHTFAPGVLSALGLGTGLVGFARQLQQPNYAQLLMPHLALIPANLQYAIPSTISNMAKQYSQLFQPAVESIRSIPEGHCRYRAVCEVASQLIKSSRFMATTMQRFSATIYLNFGTEYSKAWLDGIVESDCAVRYSQCSSSPLSMITNKLVNSARP